MSEPQPDGRHEDLGLVLAERIERLRGRFEVAWDDAARGGPWPELESYLGEISEPDRSAIRRALEPIDHEYRRRLTPIESSQSDETIGLFETAIDCATDQAPAARGAGSDDPDATFASESMPGRPASDLATLPATVSPGDADTDSTVGGATVVPIPTGRRRALELPKMAGYEILTELGRGGMGVVYKARQKGLDRLVALKMILAGVHAGADLLARFHTEAQAVAKLQHPHIVQVYDVGEVDGLPYFSLEFVDGGSLTELIGGRPRPPEEAAQMVETLARAMHQAHERGIVHRDLKPANILLTRSGEPKITDFGLAKRLEGDSKMTRSGAIMGTPSYMAPEQARGETSEIGPLADQYSLGAILYEMLTGRPPFQGAKPLDTLEQVRSQEPVPPTRLQPKVPRDLETICLKCLQKEGRKRYPDVDALADDLRRFLDREPIVARPVSRPERVWRWCRRNPRDAVLIGAVALLLVTVASVAVVAAERIYQAKLAADRARNEAERLKTLADAQRTRAEEQKVLADRHAEAALKAQEEAGQQAQLALGTIYDVVTTADEKLRTRAEMGPLRIELLQLAMKKLDQISRRAATSSKADRTMGVALQRMGSFYGQMGMTDQQVLVYRRSLEIFDRLIAEEPEEDWNRFDAAISYDSLGEIGRETEPEPAKLFDLYGRSLKLREELVSSVHAPKPTPFQRQRALAVSYIKLAALHLEVGDPAKARECALSALAASEADVPLDAGKADARREQLSSSRYFLGRSSLRTGDADLARRSLGDCVRLRQEAVKADPLSAYAKQELGRAQDALGDLEIELRCGREGLEHYREAHRIFEALHAKDRGNLEFRWYLGNVDYHLGTVYRLLGDAERAEAHDRACLETRELLLKNDPKNVQRQIELMLVRARLGRHREAAQAARQVCDYAPGHPGKLFSAACAYALCIPAVSRGGASTPEEEALRRDYSAKALEAIDRAIAHGFRDSRALEGVPELEPLRGREDFRSLLTKLAKR